MGRLALVTGGTTGIGAATCKALKAAGYDVAANYVVGEDQAKQFEAETGVRVFCWDVTQADACVKGVEAIAQSFGKPVEILVNNAGITRDSMMHRMPVENWDAVITTNLSSNFYMSRAVIQSMRDKGFGRIVNISSINALTGQLGQTNYSAAKAGIIGFSKALALENASKGITVNIVAPGYTDTDMVRAMPDEARKDLVSKIPVGRLGRPEDLARAVVFLVADEASFITGETLSVNGGQRMP